MLYATRPGGSEFMVLINLYLNVALMIIPQRKIKKSNKNVIKIKNNINLANY